MFEALTARVERLARERAQRLRAAVARRATEEAPGGVRVAERAQGIELSGRSLRRRLIVDARLRAFVESLR